MSRVPLPTLLENVCYDFNTSSGVDIVTHIIVYSKSTNVKPSKISSDFDHVIEWKGEFGIVDFGIKWINMLWEPRNEPRRKIIFDDCSENSIQ